MHPNNSTSAALLLGRLRVQRLERLGTRTLGWVFWWGLLFLSGNDVLSQQIIPQPVSEIMETGELSVLTDLLKEERPEYARLRFADSDESPSAGWDSWYEAKHFIYKRRIEDEHGFLYLDGDFRWVIHDLDSLRNLSRSQTKDQSLNAYPTIYMENFAWVGGYGYFRFHRNWWVLQANGGVSFWKDQASPLSLENFESAPPNVVHGIWRDEERGVYCYFTNRHALDEPNSPDASNELPDSLKAVTSRFQLWEDLDFGEDQNSFRHVADVNAELFGDSPPIGVTESKSWVILHHSNQWREGAKVSLIHKETRDWYFLKQDHPLPYGEKKGLFGWMFREDSLLVVSSGKVVDRLDLNAHVQQFETTQSALLNRKELLFSAPSVKTPVRPWKELFLVFVVTSVLIMMVWAAVHLKQDQRHQHRLHALDTQLEVIGYFSRSIFRSSSADSILDDIALRCITVLGFDHTSIYMRDDDRKRWVRKAESSGAAMAEGHTAEFVGMNDELVGSVGMSGSAEIIAHRGKDSRVTSNQPKMRSELAVPIVCDGRVIGVIDCLHSKPNFFDGNHRKVIQNIANICGQTIGRSQSELRTKELAQVYEENPGPVLRLSKGGMVLLSNKSAKSHFGDNAMLGETLKFQDLVHEAQHCLEREEVRFIKFNHGARMYQLHLLPSVESQCINVYASDVTELEQARTRAEKAERAKSDFLSVMSHEIRTPLNAIIGLNDLLLKEDLTEDQKKQLNYMQYSGRHLLTLINHVLSLESMDSGKATLNAELLNLSDVLEGISGAFRARAGEQGTAIEVECPPADECWVLGDRRWMSQMVNNLLDNAVKFTPRGTIRVSAKRGRKTNMWKVSISDTGAGIPREHLHRILDPFEQVLTDPKNTISNQGTGLGLAIVKRLAALHGGKLSVQSTLGVGSTFVLELHMSSAEAPAASEKTTGSEEINQEKRLRKTLKILVVDDNQINLLVAKKMVESLGHLAITETNGQDAIQAWLRESPDVILMDVQMPGMDGIQATAEIRELSKNKALQHIPVVALTADAEQSTRDAALQADVDKFLVKPIDTSELDQVIRELSTWNS